MPRSIKLMPRTDKRSTDFYFYKRVAELSKHIEATGSLPTSGEIGLGQWLLMVHKEYIDAQDKTIFDPNKLAALESLPNWYWRKSMRTGLDARVNEIKRWLAVHPGAKGITQHDRKDFGFNASKWITEIRNDKKNNRLTKEEISLLESIPGWKWIGKVDTRRSFMERELLWVLKNILEEDVRVGSVKGLTRSWDCDIVIYSRKIVIEYDGWWFHKNRYSSDIKKTQELKNAGYEVIRIRETPLTLITKNDIAWDCSGDTHKLAALIKPRLIKAGCKIQDSKLNTFKRRQENYQEASDPWYEGYKRLQAYINQNNECKVFAKYTHGDGYPLGQWAYVQRRSKKRGTLSNHKIYLLDQLPGWQWAWREEIRVGWEEAYKRTKDFLVSEGRFPTALERSNDGFKLGQWVSYQRGEKRKNQLSETRIADLEKLSGWQWEPGMESWMKKFNLVEKYIKQHNQYPTTGTFSEGAPIGQWIVGRRRDYKNNSLSEHQKYLLDMLPGWTIESQRGKRALKI